MTLRYTKYKNSGIEWIGEIPEHWEVGRLSSWFDERRQKVSDKDYEPLSVTKNGIFPQLENAAKSNDGDNRKLVRKGDFVINSRSDRKGSSGLSPLDGSVSLINIVIKPRNISGVFVNYLLKSNSFVEEFYKYGHGIVADLWTTRYDEMKFIKLAIPPLPEQEAIAQFLDEKCARIDEAVRIKEKQIELLKEYRQIAIHQAVTKGLNDKVKMKDSGIDWIGEIPEHWQTIPIRRVIKITDGTHDTPQYVDYGESTYPLITSKDFSEGRISFSECKYISVFDHNAIKRRSEVCNGDILMSMIGGNIGKSVIIDSDIEFSVKNVAIFKTKAERSLAKFVLYYIDSGILNYQIQIKSRGGAQGFLSLSDIKNLTFFKIPLSEQTQIVAHLETLTAKTDEAIRLKEQQIEQLKQYKNSLINEVVTGKVRVAQ